MTVTLRVTSIPTNLDRFPTESKIETAVLMALGLAGQTVKRLAQQKMTGLFNIRDTGTDSFYESMQVEVDPAALTATVGTAHPGARLQELGGTVVPVTAKALHWVNEQGESIFAQSVTIPARPYLGPATDEAVPLIYEEINRALQLVETL